MRTSLALGLVLVLVLVFVDFASARRKLSITLITAPSGYSLQEYGSGNKCERHSLAQRKSGKKHSTKNASSKKPTKKATQKATQKPTATATTTTQAPVVQAPKVQLPAAQKTTESAPEITVPSSSDNVHEATSVTGSVVTYTVSAVDSNNDKDTVTCSPDSDTLFHIGDTTVTCTAVDKNGQKSSKSFIVSVKDTTAPRITIPSDITTEATTKSGAVVTYPVSAVDAVDGQTVVSCSIPSGNTFPVGKTTVNCYSQDLAGNKATATFAVTVTDTTAPVVTAPADQTHAATSADGAEVTYPAATASDVVSGTATVTCTPASGTVFKLGKTTVTCSSTDETGNQATKSFVVNVVAPAPVIATPQDQTLEASNGNGAILSFKTSASDSIDGSTTVTCDPASGSDFPVGTTGVTCTSTNKEGGQSTSSFKVVVQDTSAPVIHLPQVPAFISATSAQGAVFPYVESAVDAVEGNVDSTCDRASGSVFPIGDTKVTCTASDKSGNKVSSSFTVTVKDVTAPVLTAPTGTLTAQATVANGAVVKFDVNANDAVSGVTAVTCTHDSGSVFPLGSTTVSCSATDAAGNKVSADFVVFVVDTIAPVVTTPPSAVAVATSPAGAVVNFDATSSSDAVDGNIVPTCDRTSGSTFAVGVTTVSCSATDKSGNKGTGSFTVTVREVAPTVVVPGDQVIEATSGAGAVVGFSASASSVSEGAETTSCNPASGSTFVIGTTPVTCTATNKVDGQSTAKSFQVTIRDTTAPALSAPGGISVMATAPSGAIVTFSVSAYDQVDGAVAVNCNHGSGALYPIGTTVVTCTAADGRGNNAMKVFNILVVEPSCTVGPAYWPAYLNVYPDVKAAKVSAAVHFKIYGFFESRAVCISCGAFIKCGQWNDEGYLTANPDVAKVYGTNANRIVYAYEGEGITHYKDFGWNEAGRLVSIANPFNPPAISVEDVANSPPIVGVYPIRCTPEWGAYVSIYPDLVAARVDGATHFAQYGANEGRNLCVRCGEAPTGMVKCGKWDDTYYLRWNMDVANVYGTGANAGLSHYKVFGIHEGRTINLMPSESASAGHYY
jgi:hypothetical protein